MTVLELLRRQRKLSQVELARRIRVHPSWLGHLEGRRLRPSEDSPSVKRLVRFFDRPLDELLSDAEAPVHA